MNIKQMSTFFVAMIVLTACASGSYTWHKQGVSTYDTNNQLSKCKYDIDMARDVSVEKAQKMVTNCMQKEGYRWVYR